MIKNIKIRGIILVILIILVGIAGIGNPSTNAMNIKITDKNDHIATFGAGCFWCVEAVFLNLKGVSKVVSGYSGGHVKNPTYKKVCSGTTGHAEVCQIYFDLEVISYKELLEVFWKTHDPTTLNRQGNDNGTQYRSVIFYHDEEQKSLAETYKIKLNESGAYDNPVVTEISEYSKIYIAEDYHQNYYNSNPLLPYCQFVIQPKLDKFREVFSNKMKDPDLE